MRDQNITCANFPPPSFRTTPTEVAPDVISRISDGKWWSPKYENCSIIFENDLYVLRSIIKWKGERLHKLRRGNHRALLISENIGKDAATWRNNQLCDKLRDFQTALAECAAATRNQRGSGNAVTLPSYQWLQWVIYMVLRDAALLVQLKRDCEMVMDTWLNHLDEKHDQDVLFISSIISKMWYLSSVMAEELNAKVYPFLYKLTALIQPVQGSNLWPRDPDFWKVPNPKYIFMGWLRETFKVSFQPAYENQKLFCLVKDDNPWIMRLLEDQDTRTLHNMAEYSEAPFQANAGSRERDGGGATAGPSRSGVQDDDSDPGIHVFPMNIKNEPSESAFLDPEIEGESMSRFGYGGFGINATPNPASINVPADPVPRQNLQIHDISDGSDSEEERKDQEYLPPWKKSHSQTSQATTSSRAHYDEVQNVNQHSRLTYFKKITQVKQFRSYWEQLFAHMDRLNPVNAREELLRRIDEYKFPIPKQFCHGLTRMLTQIKPHLINLEEVVQAYDSYPTHELFLSNFESKLNILQIHVVQLTNAKLEQQAKRRVKRQQRQREKLLRGDSIKLNKMERRAWAKFKSHMTSSVQYPRI